MASASHLPVWAKILMGVPADQDVICRGSHADATDDLEREPSATQESGAVGLEPNSPGALPDVTA